MTWLLKHRFFLLPLFLILACVGAWAQANSTVTGIITDPSGAVVSGAACNSPIRPTA